MTKHFIVIVYVGFIKVSYSDWKSECFLLYKAIVQEDLNGRSIVISLQEKQIFTVWRRSIIIQDIQQEYAALFMSHVICWQANISNIQIQRLLKTPIHIKHMQSNYLMNVSSMVAFPLAVFDLHQLLRKISGV